MRNQTWNQQGVIVRDHELYEEAGVLKVRDHILGAVVLPEPEETEQWRVTKPKPDPAIAISAAAADVVAEIDKAFTVRATPLTATEKSSMRDKMVALIAKAQNL